MILNIFSQNSVTKKKKIVIQIRDFKRGVKFFFNSTIPLLSNIQTIRDQHHLRGFYAKIGRKWKKSCINPKTAHSSSLHVDSPTSAPEGCIFLPWSRYYYSYLCIYIDGVVISVGRRCIYERPGPVGPSGFSKGPVTSRLLGRSKYLNLTPRSRGREAPALLGLGGP